MTQVLLCAGPGLLVIQKAGVLYYHRPGQPDAPVPYLPSHYPVFMRSAKEKYGLTTVLGPEGEEAPCLPEDQAIPELHRERLASGEEVYRMARPTDESAGRKQEDRATLLAAKPTAEN